MNWKTTGTVPLTQEHFDSMKGKYTISSQPKIIGWWWLPGSDHTCGTRFGVTKKPSWLNIKMMQWLMGWRWEETK